jgi:hypothetical protein
MCVDSINDSIVLQSDGFFVMSKQGVVKLLNFRANLEMALRDRENAGR